ncbi:MAG: hypothetical protein IKU95_03605, partial [Clostridia bacterium]|nr:hypothetical protein [Clostridia bacterium]
DGEEIDIRQDIDLHLAQALKDGRVKAQAHYIDDSVTAVFTFVGVTEPDVIIKLRKGDTPSTREVVDVLRAHDESRENDMENSPLYDEETVVISEITPEIGNLMHTTNFMVNCITAGGKRNLVHFDMGEGYYEGYYTDPETGAVSTEIEPWDKLVGSLLVNLPTEEDMSRRGYTFDGWYTKPKAKDDLYHQTGENALTQTVPEKQSVVILEPEKPSTDKPAPDNTLTEGAGGTVQKPGASGLKPGDSVIVQKPEPDKIAQDVNHDYTIYAQWTPLTFEVEFDLNGGKSLVYGNKVEDPGLIAPAAPSISGRAAQGTPAGKMTSAFGTAFGDSYVHTTKDCNDDNRYNLKDMEGVDPYGALPSAVYGDSTVPNPDYKNDGNHNKTVHVAFEGWYCDFDGDGDPFEEDELVRDYTVFTRFSDEQLAARKLVLVARWRSMIDIPRNVYTVRTTTNTYDGNSHEPVITFNGGEGHYYYLDKMVGNKAPDESEWLSKAYPEAEGKYPFDGDGYTIDYKRQGSDEYVRRSTGAFVAGVYDTRIERPMDQAPDQWYDKMSWYYSKNNEVFEIKKADCTIEGSLTAEADGRAVFVDVSLSSAPTDGAGGVQYKVDGGSWGGSEKLYNLSAGSHKIYVRLAEGMNYEASNSIGPVSVTTSASESSGGGFSYKLVIHTPKEGNGGTDANIYAFIGDYGFALDNEGDDFEQGSTGV